MDNRSFWSKDPFLLMRLYTDLVMNGMKDDRKWNEGPWMPFGENYDDTNCLGLVCHLYIDNKQGRLFHNHDCGLIRTEVTTRNYLSILKSIK